MVHINIFLVVVSIISLFFGRWRYWQGENGRGRSRHYWMWKEQAWLNGLKYMLWWIIIWCFFHYGFIPVIWEHTKLD